MQITILGANTFLGEHLINAIDNNYHGFDKKLWNYNEKLEGLKEAIEVVSELLSRCKVFNVSVLVHLSSTYLQCSTKWPNIFGRESEEKFLKESPFNEYCTNSKLSIVITRVGPVYGEGDRHSLVCDSLLLNYYFGFVPRIGNHKDMGMLQFTYVGNVAVALIKVGEKLLYSSEHYPCEIVIICDNTPLYDFYTFFGQIYDLKEKMSAGEDLALEEKKMRGTNEDEQNINIGNWAIPFWIFFLPYLFICWIIQMSCSLFHFNSSLNKFPSPNLFYLLLRHWTFYCSYKLRVFFDFKPPYDWETCLNRSRQYYSKLKDVVFIFPLKL
ncbi:3Beta_HSD domain-containing protein [Meloidogyne graminicola]|uniref:3Beta_HSD domain-containing protein n=1 Tax=Meloidogyne graminicola TaxID=189291 RepID=A0A8S9ZLV8_9BILA|nr:3Beta_HSD domain-containing protein [Meloidogyne graminicola]